MLYLGIDQHAKQLTISLRNDHGDMILKRHFGVLHIWGRDPMV